MRSSEISPDFTAFMTAGICTSKSVQQEQVISSLDCQNSHLLVICKLPDTIHIQIIGDDYTGKTKLFSQNVMNPWRKGSRILAVHAADDIMRNQNHIGTGFDTGRKWKEIRSFKGFQWPVIVGNACMGVRIISITGEMLEYRSHVLV